jgi:uncharacterized protein YodC (DUF2158 family)
MSEKYVSKAVDDNGDGLDVYRVVQVGSGGTSGMVTEGSDTFTLDYLEFEVVGGACILCVWPYDGLGKRSAVFCVHDGSCTYYEPYWVINRLSYLYV